MASRAKAWFVGIGAAVLFLYVLFSIALEPIVSGDIYPKFSTLRADPVGAKALYDSLKETPGLDVSRSFRPLQMLEPLDGVMIILGMDIDQFQFGRKATVERWMKLTANGGRLAVAFLPERPDVPITLPEQLRGKKSSADKKDSDGKGKPGDEDSKGKEPGEMSKPAPTLAELLGLEIKIREGTWDERVDAGSMSRKTALYFETKAPWRVLESADDGKSMIVERKLGKGSLIFVARSFPLSNEGLRDGRDTVLIARMVGSARRVQFDESHLGISDTGSVGQMIRRYGFQGAALMLMLLGGLFIWRMSSSLLPPKRVDDPTILEGEAANAGFAQLMRRAVPRNDLLAACWNEWERSANLRPQVAAVRQARAQEALTDPDPVAGFQRIQKALANPR